MKRALVTGSGGFLGRHMTRRLEDDGWDVEGWEIADGNDARDAFRLAKTRYDLVVHAAYHVGGRAAIDGTNTNLALNLELDAQLFSWAIRTQQRRIVYYSSSAAYPVEYQQEPFTRHGEPGDWRLREDYIALHHAMEPDAAYGWAKLTGERLAAMAAAHGVPVTVLRPFSGYGADQSLDYPFPSIVRRALQYDYHVWGPAGQTRDWIHVDDVIGATLAIVEAGTHEPVNLCTGVATEMGELVREAVRQLHSLLPHEHPHANDVTVAYQPDKPTGVFYRVGDPERMYQYYTPKVSVDQGVSQALRSLL